MCLIAFAIGVSDRWPLVVAANRDEFLGRPAAPLAAWTTGNGQVIISGRDLRGGGTWMGLTTAGRIAFLTNVREASPPATARSRGELVIQWLEGRQGAADAEEFAHGLRLNAAAYGGFNLVLGDFQQNAWAWLSNKPDSAAGQPTLRSETLAPGVYGLSNASLNTCWPKTTALKTALTAALQAPTTNALESPLWEALGDRTRAAAYELPHTGVPLAMEEALSSAFVDMPDRAYGTRCSSLLVATAAGDLQNRPRWKLDIEERTYLHGAQAERPRQPGQGSQVRNVTPVSVCGINSAQTTWQAVADN